MLELAIGLPAAGAIAVGTFQRRRGTAAIAGILFAVAALVSLAYGRGRSETFLGLQLQLPAPLFAVVMATFVAGALAVILVPAGAARLPMLWSVLAAFSAVTAMAVLVDPVLIVLVVLLVACGQAALPSLRPFVARLRAPAFGAVALGLGLVLGAGVDAAPLAKLAGLATVLGLTAMIGLAPYVQPLDPREPAPSSSLAWLAFLGPAIAVAMAIRVAPNLDPDSGAAYTEVLLGLGLFNIGIGGVGSFLSRETADAWRYSFLGDWGLVLVGFALPAPAGAGAAYLVLASILLVRLPLYLLARPALARGQVPGLRPWGLVIAAALAGAAPFAGFPARLLLLRSATGIAWPLALVLAASLLIWLPQSVRLAATIGRPGRGVALILVLLGIASATAGVYPAPLLRFLGVG